MTAFSRLLATGALLLALPGAAALGAQATAQSPRSAAPSVARTSAPAADSTPVGAPVVVRGDTVLYVPGPHGSFTAQERAVAVAERVHRFSRSGADSIILVPSETATDLMVGESVLMAVTDGDAALVGRPRADLAAEFATALKAALKRVSVRATARTVALGALWALLATSVLVVLLTLTGRSMPKLCATIESWRRTRMPALRIQRLEILSADHLTDFLLGAARVVRLAVVLLLLYLYVTLVLSFFPWTRQLSGSIVNYVGTPLRSALRACIAFVPNILFIAVIVVVARYSLKLIRLVFTAIQRGTITLTGFDREWATPTYAIVRFLVIAFAAVVMFPYLPGSKSEAFKGVSLFLALLFSLGSSSAVANVVAGVMLTYTRAFRVGDRVKMGDTMGDVVAKSLLVTRVRTPKNVEITIPNAMVLASHIVNYSAMAKVDGLILHTGVTIGYDTPWKQVHELLIAAAKATPDILGTPAPFVLQTSLDDFYVSYEINAYTDQPGRMLLTYSQLHANIQDKFNEAGVEIMSPHYATLRDGNMTTIPAGHLPENYQPPAFRVQRMDGGTEQPDAADRPSTGR